jgi:hypothetical protein
MVPSVAQVTFIPVFIERMPAPSVQSASEHASSCTEPIIPTPAEAMLTTDENKASSVSEIAPENTAYSMDETDCERSETDLLAFPRCAGPKIVEQTRLGLGKVWQAIRENSETVIPS